MKNFIDSIKKSYVTILIGFIGGYIGVIINLPLPWLLGSLGINLLISFTKFNLSFSSKLLNPVFLFIGIILGGTLNVTLLYKIHLWLLSSIAMLIYVIISTIIVSYYFIKICKFEKIISILAALPGAFVPISAALLEIENKHNHKKVIIPQATRVIFIVCMLPIIFVYQKGFVQMKGFNYENIYNLKYYLEIILLCILCFFGSKLVKRLNIPSPTLIAAMMISGFLYTFEIVNSRFPDIFINIAFVFLGTALGSRLNGLKIKELLFFSFHGIVMSMILMIIAAITAYVLQILFGFDFLPTFLSFTPGGIHEMVIISVAYNIDPIFVSYHHFLRIIIIVLLLPFLLKRFNTK